MITRSFIVLFISVVSLAACSEKTTLPAPPPEQPDPVTDQSQWQAHGGSPYEQRFSPLADVTTDNASTLGLAWSYDLGTSKGIEATPIVSDGVMYVTGTWNIVTALDAKTGALLWRFDPEVDKSKAKDLCCGVVNRGVAVHNDKVYTGTIDGRLIALDASTGNKIWDVLTVDPTQAYTITGAPRIIKDKVLIGNGGAEFGVRGYISAYHINTGEMAWRFYTVPGNPEDGFENEAMREAAKTWTGEWWAPGGGGTVWDSMAYDPELDLLYIGTGNGSPWNQAIRSPGGGDNLYLSSIVALNPNTGDYVWHYQTTPGDTWDYTATQHMILADLEIDGQIRKIIMQAPKNGFFYVLDRLTGEFISGENFVKTTWAKKIDPKTGRPIEEKNARWGAQTKKITLFPGSLGAHNWHPMAFSQKTGLVYIPAQEIPAFYAQQEDYEYNRDGWNTGNDFGREQLPTNKLLLPIMKRMLKGRLIAWDPVAQKQVWSHEYNGPWNGGVLATAGNLVFQGSADAHLNAYNATTGEQVWRFFAQTGIVAAPISYEIDGEQYIAVASGWGGAYTLILGGIFPAKGDNLVGRVLVFKLGATGALPVVEVDPKDLPTPPKPTASKRVVKAGLKAYNENCVACHGLRAMTSGQVPSLRHSPILSDADSWNMVVMDGALASQGMPSFANKLDPKTAEAIRAFVIAEANSSRDEKYYNKFSQ